MKTTTIGRIGAIVTGAAMLGTAVASAFAGAALDTSGLQKGFFVDNGVPQVQVVVGEKAAASDGAAAGQIAAMIGNMAFATTTVKQAGGSMEVAGGTTTCTPSAAECAAGNAAGQVKLSWAAIGLMGDLEQKQMSCGIYKSGMNLSELTDGGDGLGDWSDLNHDYDNQSSDISFSDRYVEVYTPEDTVANNMIGSCEVSKSAVSILKTGEFKNEICSICYNFCDIALGCEPHQMSEFVEIDGSYMNVKYDCAEGKMVYNIDNDGAIKYNIFTDDIVDEDLLDAETDGDLIAQSYLGKIILGQHEYYVEDLDDNSLTIVCGGKGTVTTSAPMEYIPPAVGSACDAADSGQKYSIKLVGAQTIEEKGVVDVTLEVTKPDGTTEQVTSGISGTPVVGDIKVKLQRGTAASNVITGEQSFSAEVLVWYVPSEYTFNIASGSYDGTYDEAGVDTTDMDDVRAEWLMTFNGNDVLNTVHQTAYLEDNELLYGNMSNEWLKLPVDENNHYNDCYEDAVETEGVALRFIQFNLLATDDTLQEGELINLPFNDGKYLLSELKFGYKGLYDDEWRDWSMQEKTKIGVEVSDIESWNNTSGGTGEMLEFLSKVTLTYTDRYNTKIEARVDEGPFAANDIVLYGDDLIKIKKIRQVTSGSEAAFNVTYQLYDKGEWKSDPGYWKQISNAWTYPIRLDSQIYDTMIVPDRYLATESVPFGHGKWFIDTADTDINTDAQLYMDMNNNINSTGGGGKLDMVSGIATDLQTELGSTVVINGAPDWIRISGATDSGAEPGDEITITVNNGDTLVKPAGNSSSSTGANVNLSCADYGASACKKILYGQNDGTMISKGGSIVQVTGDTDATEPGLDEDDFASVKDVISKVSVTVPENELRPTVFFGMESSQNKSSITITEANKGAIVNIGGIDVTVEEFGVSVTGGGVVVGGTPMTVSCNAQTVTCPEVSVSTKAPASIGYKLVILDSEGPSKANLVLIGGPAVNSMTEGLVTVDDLCPSEATIKQATANKLVVAGCEAADTASAADALVAWLKANV